MAWEEAPLRMDDSKVEIADDYTKRKCVFRLKTSSGSECLFQVYINQRMYYALFSFFPPLLLQSLPPIPAI